MKNDNTYKEKFAMLKNWMPSIIDSVKKDLRNEHLKRDIAFVKRYFPGKNPNKLSVDELAEAYLRAIVEEEHAEELAEFVSNRWLLKHSDLYYFFEKELSGINPNFTELQELDKHKSLELMESSIQQFGAPNTYLFCILNSVVFPQEVLEILSQRAETKVAQASIEAAANEERQSFEAMQRNYEQQISRLTDKYEKKLMGMQKKYLQDVDSLKKQVANLQRKLCVEKV